MHACIWKLDASHFRWQSYALGARCTMLGARCNHTRTPVRAACTVVAWLSHDYTDHPVSHWTNTVPKEKIYFFTMMQHRLSHVDIPVGEKTLQNAKHGTWESKMNTPVYLCYIHFVWYCLDCGGDVLRALEAWVKGHRVQIWKSEALVKTNKRSVLERRKLKNKSPWKKS